MKSPRGRDAACISLLLLLLPPLLLHLPAAQSAPSRGSSPPPPPPPPPRNPWARSRPPAWLSKRPRTEELAALTARMWPTWMPLLETPRSRPHLLVSPRCGRDFQQPGSRPQLQLSWTPAHRAKRHAAARRQHGQLMRVGCALGTCQVQNLNHRLWLLKGQLGRHESAPMNPSSPHSYG